jgi:hypothetical protein
MITSAIFASVFAASSLISAIADEKSGEMTFTADRIAVDNVTKAAVASGHVVAVSAPYSLRSEYLEKTADGKMLFADPTTVTTCTNAVGHTHWNATGELEYRAHDAVILRNAWLRFYEIPIFWLPYLYYPLETDCGFSWMPGYTGRWGAYLLTKTQYHLLGDRARKEGSWWLRGATRIDLRYKNGIAVGEDLEWGLGSFGHGQFKVYYAWDEDADRYDSYAWTSGSRAGTTHNDVERDRYGVELRHDWEPTERDTVRVRAQVQSDILFLPTFVRQSFFSLKNQWLGYESNGVFWEHLENGYAYGAEASGPLNRFYGGVGRLPEVYFDVNPTPVFGLPVNYETESRIGYLTRQDQRGMNRDLQSPHAFNPGQWAEYDTFRFDTYHRLTAPFRTFDDVLAVAPRLGYHGTFWNNSGHNDLSGWSEAHNARDLFRSIGEFGVTFATRGEGWVSETWRHLTEPYLDVLAQEAWYTGAYDDNRPYVFDAIDASVGWEDQFAGRARNLPYSYYGVTPGWRNAWSRLDDKGNLRQVLDFDVYVAAQFNRARYLRSAYPDADEFHRLAKPGSPNYGRHGAELAPGARLRWTPSEDTMLLARVEYDSDANTIAMGDLRLTQRVNEDFSCYFNFASRDYRVWDFSSTPFRNDADYRMRNHEYNAVRAMQATVGFTHQVCDWLAWSPYVRWDCRQGELDEVGGWIDYLTDCLGFRLQVSYENEYSLYWSDYYTWGDEWRVGFYIYLRAFGADSGNLFSN